MIRKYTNLIQTYRWQVIIGTLLAVSGLGLGLPGLYFVTDHRVYFDPADPDLLAHQHFQDVYNREVHLLVAVEHGEGIFSQAGIGLVKNLTAQMWTMPHVSRVDSLTNFQYIEGNGDDIIIAEFFQDIPKSKAAWEEQIKKAENDRVISNLLLSRDHEVTLVIASLSYPEDDSQAVFETHDAVVAQLQQLEQQYPGSTFHVSGIAEMERSFAYFSKKDMGFLLPLMIVVMLAIMLMIFRSITATLLPLLNVCLSIVAMLGIAGFLGLGLAPQTSITPEILITVAIAGSVHIQVSFFKQLRAGLSQREAINVSLEKNLIPCFISALTTAIGFYSILLQRSPPQQLLGLLSGTGVIIAFLLSVSFMPALMSLIPVSPKQLRKKNPDRSGHPLATQVIRHKKIILFIFCLAIPVIFTGLSKVKVNNQWYHYFDDSIAFRQASDFLNAKMPAGLDTIDFSIGSGKSDGVKDPTYLKKLEALVKYIESLPEVSYASSILDIIKKVNQSLHSNDPAFYAIPDNAQAVSEYLFLYSLSMPMGMDMNNRLTIDSSSSRLTVWMHQNTAQNYMKLEEKIMTYLHANFPEANSRGVGPTMMMSRLALYIIPDMLKSLMVALIIITITLTLVFRSWKLGALSMIPNILPIGAAFAYMGYKGSDIDWGVSVIAAIGLGLVVDDTVHFIARFQRYQKKRLPARQIIHKTFEETSTAIIITTLIMVAGFTVFTLSKFKVNSDLGFYTAMIVALALLADLFMVPALFLAGEGSSRTIQPQKHSS